MNVARRNNQRELACQPLELSKMYIQFKHSLNGGCSHCLHWRWLVSEIRKESDVVMFSLGLHFNIYMYRISEGLFVKIPIKSGVLYFDTTSLFWWTSWIWCWICGECPFRITYTSLWELPKSVKIILAIFSLVNFRGHILLFYPVLC